jgi:hypothetical protein
MADCTNQDITGILRAMAWERAKGELKSIEQSFIGAVEKFTEFADALTEFVEKVESSGLHE